MQTISIDKININCELFEKTTPDKLEQMMNTMSNEHPTAVAYFLAVGKEFLQDKEQEYLLFLGLMVWNVMTAKDTKPKTISEEMLYKQEEKNLKMLNDLESSDNFTTKLESIIKDHNQPDLLRFVLYSLLDECGADKTVRDENMGLMFVFLKTIIDSWDE